MKTQAPPPKPKTPAEKIVASILDQGLATSTWRDNNPAAYEELLKYRADLVADVDKVLNR